MGIMMTKEDDKNQDLTRRISADLRAKMDETSKSVSSDPDFAEDSEYVKDFKKTSKFAWIFVVVLVVVVTILIVVGLNH